MIGRKIKDRYYLLERLGGGGEGTVYLARDEELGKYWAVKEVSPDRQEEMQALRKLSHSMLPQIVDYVQEENGAYLVMEYIQGQSLEQIRKKGPCARQQVIRWGIRLCQVLEYLHTRYPPVVHLDVKPSNILLTGQGDLYLIDLGSCGLAGGKNRRRKTAKGTPGYAPPEQADGEVDVRCDIYSLGKTMEVLVGGRARAGEELWKVIRKCVQPDREQRYPDCRHLEADLRKRLHGSRHRCLLLLLVLGLAGGMLAGRFLVLCYQGPAEEEKVREITQEDFLERYTEIQNQIQKGLLLEEGQARSQILAASGERLEKLQKETGDFRAQAVLRLTAARLCREQNDSKNAREHYEWLVRKKWQPKQVFSEYGLYLLEIGETEASWKLFGLDGVEEMTAEHDNGKKWKEMLREEKKK